MKKTLILILVVLMALFAVSVITAQTEEPVQTDPAAAVTEPAAEGADIPSGETVTEEPSGDQTVPEETVTEENQSGDQTVPEETVTEENQSGDQTVPEGTVTEENQSGNQTVPEETVTEENQSGDQTVTDGQPKEELDPEDQTKEETPAEAAAPKTTAPAPAEDEDSVIYMTVTIAGTQLTVKYDENDTNTYTAEGFTVLSVDCTNEKGEPVTCPSFNEKKDLIFDGSDRAELPGNKIDRAGMGLSEDQFSLDLKAENVEVSFVVIDGYVEVVEDYTEPEVIDQTGTDEPEEEPEETPEETEPEDEDQETEKPAEEASDDVIVYSSSCMTIRLIKKPAEPVEEPAGEPAAEPAAAAAEGEEENADELNENEEELNNEGEDQNGDDLNNDAEDLKDEDEKENIEEQNENDEEKGEEENAEDQDKDEEEQNEEDLKDENEKENAEEQKENDEENDAEDTDKDGFHTIVSGDGSAAGMIPEITDPAAGEGEDAEAGEGTEEDTAPKSIALAEDMVVFTAADAESEALAFTFEEGMELTVLSVDENGWAAVEFADGTQGYIQMPAEEEQPETEPGTETAEGTEEDTAPKTIALTEDMVIFTAADEESEALAFTFEEGMELTILSVDENGWAAVEFPDGTQGYVQMPAEEEQPETEPGTETETDETPKSILLTADMVVFTAADAESEALAFTFEEGMELTILSVDENGWAEVLLPDGTLGFIQMPVEEEKPVTAVIPAATAIRMDADGLSTIFFNPEEDMEVIILDIDGDWVKVKLPDGRTGYIYIDDIEFEGKPEKVYIDKKVTIFSNRRAEMAEGETVTLTSKLEGFEDCEVIIYQWECDKGTGFEDIEGENGESFSYKISKETLPWSWRLTVYYK